MDRNGLADFLRRRRESIRPPSPQMLRALARALRLTEDETDHLYRLAGHAVPDRAAHPLHVRPSLLFVLDQMRDAAAFVCSDTYVARAQNELAKRLMGDLSSSEPTLEDGIGWQWFTDPQARAGVPVDGHDDHCEVLATTDGQTMVVLTPPPGTTAAEDLRLLAVVGEQAMG